MHQLRMRPFKPFWDEPKTHPPLPKVFGFFSLFSTPKFFLPTYLPFTYLPPSHLPPPSYLPHLILHSLHCQSSRALEVGTTIVRALECLKGEPPLSKLGSAWSGNHHCQSSRVLKVGATIIKAWEHLKWDPELIGQSRSLKVSSLL
jgi:hypothetical protein